MDSHRFNIWGSVSIVNTEHSLFQSLTWRKSHLAEKWATTYVEPNAKRRLYPTQTVLSTIEHFVLLDLLGAPRPLIRSYFPSTGWLFDEMASAESRLGTAGALDEKDFKWDAQRSGFFLPRTGYQSSWGGIEDDHLPFLERGVNILHIIASPFPTVWHTLKVSEPLVRRLIDTNNIDRTMPAHCICQR